MSLYEELCLDPSDQKFWLTFGFLVGGSVILMIVAAVLIVILCLEDYRRRKRFKRKRRQSKGRRLNSSDILHRVLTYLAYMNKVGHLKEKDFKPKDALNLLKDSNVDEERKQAKTAVLLFFSEKSPDDKEAKDSSNKSSWFGWAMKKSQRSEKEKEIEESLSEYDM